MPVRTFITVAMMLASTAACGVSTGETDDKDEVPTESDVSLALEHDGTPGPLDYPVPVLDVRRPQLHDLRPIGSDDIWDEPRKDEPSGRCSMHYLKIHIPGTRTIEIPVTECN